MFYFDFDSRFFAGFDPAEGESKTSVHIISTKVCQRGKDNVGKRRREML